MIIITFHKTKIVKAISTFRATFSRFVVLAGSSAVHSHLHHALRTSTLRCLPQSVTDSWISRCRILAVIAKSRLPKPAMVVRILQDKYSLFIIATHTARSLIGPSIKIFATHFKHKESSIEQAAFSKMCFTFTERRYWSISVSKLMKRPAKCMFTPKEMSLSPLSGVSNRYF